jgi:signal transduction histidine kinase
MAKVGGWEYDLRDGSVAWTKEVYNIHELPLDLTPTYDVVKKLYDKESSQLLTAAVEACISEKKAYSLELVGLTGNGERKWVRANGKPVTDKQGNVVFIRGTVQDIDEKKQIELEFEQSMQIIHSQNQRLNNYAHIVAHNLRTHAGNIESILTMIGESEDPEEKEELMSHLFKISAGLNETIEHLNTVAKIQIDIQAAREKMRFADVFDKTIPLLLQTITETEANIVDDFSKLPEIEYLPAYLESIMLNLLSNALKYRHPDRKPEIRIRTFSQEGRQYLEVADNGAGIDLEKHGAKLFGMYKTFHRHPDAKGIGLFLTKNQVEALGGSIHVSSKPGVGSTFTIQF